MNVSPLRRFPLRRALVLSSALSSVACGGSEEGLPIDSSILALALTAASTDESAVAVRSDAAALSVEEVGVAFRELAITPCASDSAPIGREDYPVDLTALPAAQATFESGVSEYCSLSVVIEPYRADEPEQLSGLGVFVRGTRSDGVPFEIHSALPQGATFASSEAFGTAHLALGFDLATWFDGVDVNGANVVDGAVLVDEATNPELLAAFEANTREAVALYDDADRDGVLDDDELESIATPE
jgi:hypothetical protein